MTNQERLIIEQMQKGYVLVKRRGVEGLTTDASHDTLSQAVKKGTIESLLKQGLVERSAFNGSRYYLTEKGLFFGREK